LVARGGLYRTERRCKINTAPPKGPYGPVDEGEPCGRHRRRIRLDFSSLKHYAFGSRLVAGSQKLKTGIY